MSSTNDMEDLRPLERRVLEMRESGLTHEDIAAKIRKSPDFVERLIGWTDIPRTGTTDDDRDLTPIERRVLDLRADGLSHQEIAARFKKSERYIRQVNGLAHFKEGQRLLTQG